MKIRKSRPEDLERMLQLYADARVFMAEHGNPTQWANGYPEPEMLHAASQAFQKSPFRKERRQSR